MFGILIGTLCLIGLIAVVRHGHRWHRGWGHGCGYGHGPHHGYGGYGVQGPRWFLRSLFARLGTSAAQEKVIVDAMRDLQEQSGKLWTEWSQSRADLAEALRADAMDSAKVKSAFGRHDSLLQELRAGALAAMEKVHAVLDPEQRRTLASMLESPRGFHRYAC